EGLPLPPGLKAGHSLRLYDQPAQPLEGFPVNAWALAVTSYAELAPAIAALTLHLPDSGEVLVFAHFAPLNIDSPAIAPLLAKPNLRIHWIAGHEHASESRTLGNI